MRNFWLAAISALAISAAGAAVASPVTYELTGSGNYNLAGVDHIGSYDILATGDTSNITQSFAPLFLNGDLPAFGVYAPFSIVFDFQGVGTVNLSDPGYIFYSQQSGLAGFGTSIGGDMIYFAGLPSNYALATDLGPLLVSESGANQTANTSAGELVFGNASEGYFTSTVAEGAAVPEPATWAMLILGVAMIGLAARRRHASALVLA